MKLAFKEKYGRYKRVGSGKVREIYRDTTGDDILLVATDRVSAFDRQLKVVIPDKGKILTAISAEMMRLAEREWGYGTAYRWANVVPMTVLDWDRMHDMLDEPNGIAAKRPIELEGRVTQMDDLDMLEVECIVRGHITGSGWKAYAAGEREICGVPLKEGLRNGDKLPKPIFTPTTKAPEGEHDENITFGEMAEVIGDRVVADEVFCTCTSLFAKAYDFFLERDIILADTKFELGLDGSRRLLFADELLTPDSSRFWDAKTFVPGEEPLSYDKQIIRNYLAGCEMRSEKDLTLPDEIVEQTRQRYIELYEKITGKVWPE